MGKKTDVKKPEEKPGTDKWQTLAWMAAVASAVIAGFAYFKSQTPTTDNHVVMPKIENNPRIEVNVNQPPPSEPAKAVPAPTVLAVTNNAAPQIPPSVPTPVPPQATLPTGPIPGGDWPGLNQDWRINITTDLPHNGTAHDFDFFQNVEQGDHLRFHIAPVNGAAMQTQVFVSLAGNKQRFEYSRAISGRLDWTMAKAIPGNRVEVKIRSFQPGALDVRVEKAN